MKTGETSAHVARIVTQHKGRRYEHIYIRRSYREGGRVKHETLGRLTGFSASVIEAISKALQGQEMVSVDDSLRVVQSLPHGHVAAVLGTLRRISLHRMIDPTPSTYRSIAEALITETVLNCGKSRSKLEISRGLRSESPTSSLPDVLGLDDINEDVIYRVMDWLLERKDAIQSKIAARYLETGSLILYDITSAYFEGRKCPLARLGHSHDGRHNKPQILIGLLCSAEGCPVAVEVFEGNKAEPLTVGTMVSTLRSKFGLDRVVLCTDRGILTQARIQTELRDVEGLDWITSLRAPQIKKILRTQGNIQLTLFDEKNLAEIEHPDYPGERLIVCRNPLLQDERRRKRDELLASTEATLQRIVDATRRTRRPLKGRDRIGLRVGRVINKYKVGKHFRITITDTSMDFARRADRITGEQALDGIYIIRTSAKPSSFSSENVVMSYKRLAEVERAFKCMKNLDLNVRPVYHRLSNRVRSHVFICMLAYYVEWHMRKALAPLLFDDEDREEAKSSRRDVVAPAVRSESARIKLSRRVTKDGHPVHSFHSLLGDLATVARNVVRLGQKAFQRMTVPSRLQRQAFKMLAVKPSSL